MPCSSAWAAASRSAWSKCLRLATPGEAVGARLAPGRLQVAAQTVDLGHAGAQVALDLRRLVLHPLRLLDHAAHDRADPLAGRCRASTRSWASLSDGAEPGGLAAERRQPRRLARDASSFSRLPAVQQRALLGGTDEEALIELGAAALVQDSPASRSWLSARDSAASSPARCTYQMPIVLRRRRQPQRRQCRQHGVRPLARLDIMSLARHPRAPPADRSCLASTRRRALTSR